MALATPWLGEYVWEECTTDGSEPKGVPLPDEVLSMFRPSQCLLCGTVVANNLGAFTHYESKGHFKKVAQHMRETYKVLGVLKSSTEKFKPIRCDICNVDITSRIVYVQHYDGKQHLKNLKKKPPQGPVSQPAETKAVEAPNSKQSDDLDFENPLDFLKNLPPPPPLPKLGAYSCSLCNVNTTSKAQMEVHNNGARHQRNVSKLADGELRDFFLRNGNCEPVVTDVKELTPPETKPISSFPQAAAPVEGFQPFSQGMTPFPPPMTYAQYPQSGGSYDYNSWYQMQQMYGTGQQVYGTGQPPFTSGPPPFTTGPPPFMTGQQYAGSQPVHSGQQYAGSQPVHSGQYQNQTCRPSSNMPQQPCNSGPKNQDSGKQNYNAGQGNTQRSSNFSNTTGTSSPFVNNAHWKTRRRSPPREPEVRVTPLPDDFKIKSLAVLPFITLLAAEAKADEARLTGKTTESADATKSDTSGVEGPSNQDPSQCASDNKSSETNVGNMNITTSPEKVGEPHPELKSDGDKGGHETSQQMADKPDETAASIENEKSSQESFKQFKIVGRSSLGKSRFNSFLKVAAEKKSKEKKMVDDEIKSKESDIEQSKPKAPEICTIAFEEESIGVESSEVKTSPVHAETVDNVVDLDHMKDASEPTVISTPAMEETIKNEVEESSCIVKDEESPCIVIDDESPCIVKDQESPCIVKDGENPFIVNDEESPCIVKNEVDESPCIEGSVVDEADVLKLDGGEAYDPDSPQDVASTERGDKSPDPQSLADESLLDEVKPLAKEDSPEEVKLMADSEIITAQSLPKDKLPVDAESPIENKLPEGDESLSKPVEIPVGSVNDDNSSVVGQVEKVGSTGKVPIKTEIHIKKEKESPSELDVAKKKLIKPRKDEKITKTAENKKAAVVGETKVKETPKKTDVPPEKSSSEVKPKKICRKKARMVRQSRSTSSSSSSLSYSSSHKTKSRSRSPPKKATKRLSSSWSPSPEANHRWSGDHKRFDNYGYKNNYNNRQWKNNRGRQNWGYNNRNNWEWEHQQQHQQMHHDDGWDNVDERHGRYPDETDEFGRVRRRRDDSKKKKDPKMRESRKRKKDRRRSHSSYSSQSSSRSRSRSRTKYAPSSETKKRKMSKKEVSPSLKSRVVKPIKPVKAVEPVKVAVAQPAISVAEKPRLEETKRQSQNVHLEKKEHVIANKEGVAPPKPIAPVKHIAHTAKPENVEEVHAKHLSPKPSAVDQKQLLKALEREKEKHDILKKVALVKLKLVEREKEKELLKKKKKKKKQKEKSKKRKKRKKESSSSSSSSSESDSESSVSSGSSSSTTNSQKLLMAKLLEKLKHDFAEPLGKPSSSEVSLAKSEKRKKKKRKKDRKKEKKSSKSDKESSSMKVTSFPDSKGGYHCKYCDLTTDSGSAFIQHVVSEKHKLMYKLVKEKMNK